MMSKAFPEDDQSNVNIVHSYGDKSFSIYVWVVCQLVVTA